MIPSLLQSCSRSFPTIFRCAAAFVFIAGIASAQDKVLKPRPDAPNAKYGPHVRNVFDLWLPKGPGPHPLVLYFHFLYLPIKCFVKKSITAGKVCWP